jgi:predicted molibdopterin-dependent oxidoreductase YjgC
MPALSDVMKPQYGPNPKVDTIFLFGVDPSEELPILDVHLKRAVRRGKAKLIIAHPRAIELTRYDGPYMSYKPGTEATLLNGLTKAALALVKEKPEGVDKLVADVDNTGLKSFCGVDPDAVEAAAKLLVESEKALILYGPMAARGEMGPQTINGLTNLTLLTGHADRLGFVGLEANSQGARDMGVLPNQLPGYGTLDSSETIQRFERAWGATLPKKAGKGYKAQLDSAGKEIKALYIMGANPASERPQWAANLDKLDFLVVQDLFLTETAQKADVVLPALSWAEADGTFTNLERRVQRAPKAVRDPQSKAAADWMILDHLAGRMGVKWPYADERAVTADIAKTVPIYSGMSWDALGDQGRQWDAAKVRAKAQYKEAEQRLVSTEEQAFTVVSGTVLFDGGNLFRLTTQMHNIAFGAQVGLHPADAAKLGVADGGAVKVQNKHGALTLTAKVDEQVKAGTVWIPESLPGAPVGALLNGRVVEQVRVEKVK